MYNDYLKLLSLIQLRYKVDCREIIHSVTDTELLDISTYIAF